MPRKPSQTMQTFTHATNPRQRAALHVLPAPTPEGMTHYITVQVWGAASHEWIGLTGGTYAPSLDAAHRALRRMGYVVPTPTEEAARLASLRSVLATLRAEFDTEPENAGCDFLRWARNQRLMTSADVDELLRLDPSLKTV